MSSVRQLQEARFKNNAIDMLPHDIVIGVPDAAYNVGGKEGCLPRMSPCEFVHAAVFACADAINENTADNELRAYVTAFLSAPFEFRIVPSETFRYQAMQQREDLRTDADAVQWTALQKIANVLSQWTKGMSAHKLAAEIKKM